MFFYETIIFPNGMDMFKSIRSKLIAIMALILLLTAVVIIYITHRDVGREILHSEQQNVENIMDMVFLNIQGVYRGLISDRVGSIEQSKAHLKRNAEIALSGLDFYFPDPALTDREAQNSRKLNFIDWISRLEMESVSFFAADDNHRVVFDPGDNFVDKNLRDVKDIKNQPLSNVVNRPGASYEQFAVFSSGKSGAQEGDEKLAYLKAIPRWDWVLGVFVDISHIRDEEKNKLQELTRGLADQLEDVRIAGSGSIFIFDADEAYIVPPAGIEDTDALKNDFSELVREEAENKQSRIRVDGDEMIAYTRFFRPLNWYLSALIPESAIQAPARRLVQRQSLFIGGILFLGMLIAIFFVRHISRPLGILAAHARGLARNDLTSDEFDFGPLSELTEQNRDEVGALAESFLFMQKELRENVRRLLASTRANERIESELLIARNIQMNFLSRQYPPFPERRDFDIYAMLEPARHVGGDLYDFFLIDENHLFVSAGDVSDKGVPAALFMAVTKTLMKAVTEQGYEPSRILARVNNELCRGNDSCMFVTLFCAILNLESGKLHYSNAGHNPPLFQKSGREAEWLNLPPGMVLGGMEDAVYQTWHLDMAPGDKLLIYTDGVTEAMNPHQALYSDERLRREVRARASAGPEKLVTGILETVNTFSEGAPQSDDITMVGLLYNGQTTKK